MGLRVHTLPNNNVRLTYLCVFNQIHIYGMATGKMEEVRKEKKNK
jgi:hypothetical protein